VRHDHSLIEMRVAEENRRDAPMVAPPVMASITAMLEQIDDELLISIPGIAETTAAWIRGELPNITELRDVKAVAAYAGLSTRHSGPARSSIVVGSQRPETPICGARCTSPCSPRYATTGLFASSLNVYVPEVRPR
jgi:transposase